MASCTVSALHIIVRVLTAAACILGIVAFLTLRTAGLYDLCIGPQRVHLGARGLFSFFSDTLQNQTPVPAQNERKVIQNQVVVRNTEVGLASKDVAVAKTSRHILQGIRDPNHCDGKFLYPKAAAPLMIEAKKRESILPQRPPVFESLDTLYTDTAFCIEQAMGAAHVDRGISCIRLDPHSFLIFLFGTSNVRDAQDGLNVSHAEMHRPVDDGLPPIRSHAGFLRAYMDHRIKDRVEYYMRKAIRDRGVKKSRFIIAGHSRGAVFTALLASERALCTEVMPTDTILRPKVNVRFILCGCPKMFDPYSTERLRNTDTFKKHVLVVQHANDVVPQLPLASTRRDRDKNASDIVAYCTTERLVPRIVRLYSYASTIRSDTPDTSVENRTLMIQGMKESATPPPLQAYHELQTYASSLRTESNEFRSEIRDTALRVGTHDCKRCVNAIPWISFLWNTRFKVKQD